MVGDWDDGLAHFCASERISVLDPQQVQGHISLLRKTVAPRNVRVVDAASHADADAYIKDMAGKGVNDLLAEFVHPPIEFLLTRLVAYTPITPNQVSYFNALLSLAAVPLIASGHLWAGIFCNLLRGVCDGVDGKLARMTLRESQGGDQIDHVVDRIYLPVFFLALGWHLGAGALDAPVMQVAYGLVGIYGLNRLLATWFANFVGASSGEFRPIDRLVRRIWPKRNICVLLLFIAALFGAPLYGFYAMAGLSALMVLYRGVRLDQEGRRIRRECRS
jgi:CDP-L-myo-inositol myo-inositolphosphotransferase